MRAHRITYEEGRYRFNGYQYEWLQDAVAYAIVSESRSVDGEAQGGATVKRIAASLSESDYRNMALLEIVMDGVRFHWGPYRYDRLVDAIAYATLMHRRKAEIDHAAAGAD